jgi:pimeloyl-ACP methyl ester carboxylesterase
MSLTKQNALRVSGASIVYEVCGSGPILLLIHGGGGDARAFNGVAKHLASQYTMAQIGVTYDDWEPDADLPEQGERPIENTMFLLKREFAMYDRYQFDFAALRSASIQTRIVIAAGQSGKEYVGYQNAAAMAGKLGATVVEFPSHHVGYVSHPRAFAARLQEVLGETPLP